MDSLSTNPYFWLIYFSVAGLMAWWNYRKGHSFSIGLFISVLMTPVAGLMFNLFSKPNKSVMRERTRVSHDGPRCPSCNAPMAPDARRCGSCGKKLK